jgi:uncharacterized protein
LIRVFLDTSYLLALVTPQDQNHDAALKIAQKYASNPTITTQAVLIEVGNSLARSRKQTAVDLIENLSNTQNSQIVKINPKLYDEAFNLYRSFLDKEWGFVDCMSFIVMRQHRITVALAFDKHFIQAGFQIPATEN